MQAIGSSPAVSLLRQTAVGFVVFMLALAGILSRPHFDLAIFWPANAFMLGMLLRFPGLARPATWLSCSAGFLFADALTGSELLRNLILNAANLVSVGTGYLLMARRAPEDRRLNDPLSVLFFLQAAAAAAAATGIAGAVMNPRLFGGTPAEGFLFWSSSELVNYIALLPIFLTWPPYGLHREKRRLKFGRLRVSRIAPLVALALSAVAGIMVGGPGAVAFPVPALLWCALTFSPFASAWLSFFFVTWALLSIRLGVMDVGADLEQRAALMSTRVGVALVALAPLFVAAVTMARHKVLAQLRDLADRDPLTGLLNRRAFLEIGQVVLQDAERRDLPVTVMMLDLDHFKGINDTYGHDGGDRVLIAFARILTSGLRPQDAVGRVGGEEFAVILPDCGVAEAEAIAERIGAMARLAPVHLECGAMVRVTTSIGIDAGALGRTLAQMLSRADKALYRAKIAGRDRFEPGGI